MDPNYEITFNGRGTGEIAADLIQFWPFSSWFNPLRRVFLWGSPERVHPDTRLCSLAPVGAERVEKATRSCNLAPHEIFWKW
jgi:hypothetical protein